MKSIVQIGLIILIIMFVMKKIKGNRCEGFTQQQPQKVSCNCNIQRENTLENFNQVNPDYNYCQINLSKCENEWFKTKNVIGGRGSVGFNPKLFDQYYSHVITKEQKKCLRMTTVQCAKATECKDMGNKWKPSDKTAYDRGSKFGCVPINGTNKWCGTTDESSCSDREIGKHKKSLGFGS